MDVFKVFIFCSASFVSLVNGQACYLTAGDPCNTKLEMTDWHRSIKYEPEGNSYLSDKSLQYGWYRFKNEGDRTDIKMPLSSPGKYHCGTEYPIWIRGTGTVYPGIGDGIKTVVSCVDDGQNTCNFQQNICIKACSSTEGVYFVHFLYASPGSGSAYCTDTVLPCKNGTNSPTGFPPCSGGFPVLEGKPTLSFQKESTGVSTVCHYKSEKYQEQLDFLVKWFINDNLVYWEDYNPNVNEIDAFISDECDCGDCDANQCILNEKLNSQIHCEVGAKFRNSGDNVFPPGVKSNILFAGLIIQPNDEEFVINENDDGQIIEITTSFPIVMRDEQNMDPPEVFISVVSTRVNLDIVTDSCIQRITNDAPANYSIIAKRDNIDDGDDISYLKFKGDKISFNVEASRIWENQADNLPHFKVISKDVPSTTICTTTGDPHITTFDKWYYHLYAPGDYLLYRHKYLPIQVQSRLAYCGSVTCNCGVAVQIGDTHLFIDRCSNGDNHHTTYTTDNNGDIVEEVKTTAARVITAVLFKDGIPKHGINIQYTNGKYEVRLPTGSVLTATLYRSNYIEVSLTGSSDDFNRIEGLCGNFDGNGVNDVEYKNGKVPYDCKPSDGCSWVGYSYAAPASFYNIWSVKDDSLFDGKLKLGLPYEVRRYCACGEDGTTIQCNYCNGLTNGEFLECQDIQKRAADSEQDPDDLISDYEFKPFVYDPNFNISVPDFPTPSGLTEEYTRRLCNETLVNSTTYSLCLNPLNNGSVVIDDIIEGCVVDIKVFDDTSIAKETISVLQERCKVVLSRNPMYWEKTENGTLAPPADVLDGMCVNECNGMGECINGTCECYDGLGGSDCSISLVEPPLVFAVLGKGICDVQERPCKSAKVYGNKFVEGNITCHIQHINVSENGMVLLPRKEVVSGIFSTPEEVKCPLPEPIVRPNSLEETVSSGYLISISNDGELISESMAAMFLYDSVCQTCNSTAGTCTFKDNSCNINGRCYAASETNPADVCQQCQPGTNVNVWSRNQDVGCLSIPGINSTAYNWTTTEIPTTIDVTTGKPTNSTNSTNQVTTENPTIAQTNQPSTATNQVTTGNQSTASTNNQPSTATNQVTTGNQSTASTNNQPSTATNQVTTDNQRTISTNKQPSTATNLVTTDNQRTTITKNQSSTATNQVTTDNQRTTSTNNQPITATNQVTTDNQRTTSTNNQPITATNQVTTDNQKTTSTNNQPITATNQVTTDNQRTKSTNKHSTISQTTKSQSNSTIDQTTKDNLNSTIIYQTFGTESTVDTSEQETTVNNPSTTSISGGGDNDSKLVLIIVCCCIVIVVPIVGVLIVFCKRKGNGRISPEVPEDNDEKTLYPEEEEDEKKMKETKT